MADFRFDFDKPSLFSRIGSSISGFYSKIRGIRLPRVRMPRMPNFRNIYKSEGFKYGVIGTTAVAALLASYLLFQKPKKPSQAYVPSPKPAVTQPVPVTPIQPTTPIPPPRQISPQPEPTTPTTPAPTTPTPITPAPVTPSQSIDDLLHGKWFADAELEVSRLYWQHPHELEKGIKSIAVNKDTGKIHYELSNLFKDFVGKENIYVRVLVDTDADKVVDTSQYSKLENLKGEIDVKNYMKQIEDRNKLQFGVVEVKDVKQDSSVTKVQENKYIASVDKIRLVEGTANVNQTKATVKPITLEEVVQQSTISPKYSQDAQFSNGYSTEIAPDVKNRKQAELRVAELGFENYVLEFAKGYNTHKHMLQEDSLEFKRNLAKALYVLAADRSDKQHYMSMKNIAKFLGMTQNQVSYQARKTGFKRSVFNADRQIDNYLAVLQGAQNGTSVQELRKLTGYKPSTILRIQKNYEMENLAVPITTEQWMRQYRAA